MGKVRRKYDKEFKKGAVLLVIEKGRSISEVARDLGIHPVLLGKWKSLYLEDKNNAFPGQGHMKSEEEEFRRLKRELDNVKEEREILKKALAIFSKRPL